MPTPTPTSTTRIVLKGPAKSKGLGRANGGAGLVKYSRFGNILQKMEWMDGQTNGGTDRRIY